MPLNIEFKAKCHDPDHVRSVLERMQATLKGVDRQKDTYFEVPSGGMKLRDGNIERNLIFFRRDDASSPKRSEVWLAPCPEPEPLLRLLTAALCVRCVVEKRREIYFHGQTKIHVDEVPGLGNFVEVEVIADSEKPNEERMRKTCNEWMDLLGVRVEDLVSTSYSDMLPRS